MNNRNQLYKYYHWTLFVVLWGLICSCGKIYGIKKYRQFQPEIAFQKISNLGISKNQLILVSNDSNYSALKNKYEKDYPKLHKTLFQPIQVALFDSANSNIAIIANCDIGGFPNLKWNKTLNNSDNQLEQWYKYQITLDNYLLTLIPKNITDSLIDNVQVSNKTAIVKHSIFMGRQSKRLVKYIHKSNRFIGYNVLFVNNLY